MSHRFPVFSAVFLACGAVASPAFAFPDFNPAVHDTFKLLHVFGAILFMGNLIVSAMWMSAAKRTRNAEVLCFAAQAVARADWVFTLPGVILVLVPGILILGHGGFSGASWAELSLALLVLSGILWVAVLIPQQKRMGVLGREAVQFEAPLPDAFYAALKRWMMWGGIATLLPTAALVLMVYRPVLWG